ncbi:hypothetical protein NIES4102_07770 [Chondrocystis sp. NIES-4102]|nr:hypothetical protein NIES4102_07770 [Chondrocystis sp. NIES-4102]
MSKIQIAELATSTSELNVLSDRATGDIVGGYGKGWAKKLSFANIIQINNNINIQIAFGGSNYNWTNQGNNAGTSQG